LGKAKAFVRSLYSFEARKRFRRLLGDTRPDVVHLQNFRRHLTFSIVPVAKKLGIPVVMTAHDYDLICPSSLLLAGGQVCSACGGRHFYRAALKKCKQGSLAGSLAVALEGYFMKMMRYDRLIDVVVTPSRFARDKMVECGFDPARVRVINNFIDAAEYRPVYESEGHVLWAGRLTAEKGVDVLLDAAAALPGTRFLIVGDGPCRPDLEQHALKLGLGNAEFLGYVERGTLLGLVGKSLLVAMPSVWYENFPYAILEAFALGKPVVASKIGGMPELVTEGQTGMLFNAGDAAGLAEKIREIVAAPGLALEMGKKARARVEAEFDAAGHYRNIMQLYREVVR
jgi:glycosyltransferase involved in cell wall biosynthesis